MKIKMHKSFSYAPFSSNRKYNESAVHTQKALQNSQIKKKKTEEEEKL